MPISNRAIQAIQAKEIRAIERQLQKESNAGSPRLVKRDPKTGKIQASLDNGGIIEAQKVNSSGVRYGKDLIDSNSGLDRENHYSRIDDLILEDDETPNSGLLFIPDSNYNITPSGASGWPGIVFEEARSKSIAFIQSMCRYFLKSKKRIYTLRQGDTRVFFDGTGRSDNAIFATPLQELFEIAGFEIIPSGATEEVDSLFYLPCLNIDDFLTPSEYKILRKVAKRSGVIAIGEWCEWVPSTQRVLNGFGVYAMPNKGGDIKDTTFARGYQLRRISNRFPECPSPYFSGTGSWSDIGEAEVIWTFDQSLKSSPFSIVYFLASPDISTDTPIPTGSPAILYWRGEQIAS